MVLRSISVILVCSVIHIGRGYPSQQECVRTITDLRQLIEGAGSTDWLPRGPPGPAGPSGPAGPQGLPGSPGPAGATGTCACDLTEINKKISQLEASQRRAVGAPGTCYVGISTGLIPIAQLSSSSNHWSCAFTNVVLNSPGAWCAATNDQNQWIQVDFLAPRKIYRVVTQGRADWGQWVKTYRVSYGNDAAQLQFYSEGGIPKVFSGNSDQTSKVENAFSVPITARYFRIHPVTFHNHESMRFELQDC